MVLSRSCQNCIRVKRRCSLDGTCARCRARNEVCEYINPPANNHHSCDMQHLRETPASTESRSTTIRHLPLQRGPSGYQVSLAFDTNSIGYIIQTLRSCPIHRRRVYTHRDVFKALHHPPAATTLFHLVNQASRTLQPQERQSVTQNLEQGARALMTYTQRIFTEPATLLVCIQALLKALITLTVGISAYNIAHVGTYYERATLLNGLSRLCSRLFALAPWHLPDQLSYKMAWLFAESVRRTLLVAHIFCDVFSTICSGSFQFSGFVLTLPYDVENRSWWHDQNTPGTKRSAGKGMRSLRELAIESKGVSTSSNSADEFERLLVVACRSYQGRF